MYQFIETIRVKDGRIFNLTYHEERMNRTRKEVWGKTDWLKITDVWSPEELPLECSKLRFVYDEAGIHDLTCTPYTRKKILSLRLVYDNNITYPYKSVDRSMLNELKKQQGDCDEILIIRDNHLTDTSYTNVALYDGQQWFTPSTPLLPGTMRQSLLNKGILQEREILVSDIPQYQQISLFNAMMELGEVVLPVKNIL